MSPAVNNQLMHWKHTSKLTKSNENAQHKCFLINNKITDHNQSNNETRQRLQRAHYISLECYVRLFGKT